MPDIIPECPPHIEHIFPLSPCFIAGPAQLHPAPQVQVPSSLQVQFSIEQVHPSPHVQVPSSLQLQDCIPCFMTSPHVQFGPHIHDPASPEQVHTPS